jgi:hypothetical protein
MHNTTQTYSSTLNVTGMPFRGIHAAGMRVIVTTGGRL